MTNVTTEEQPIKRVDLGPVIALFAEDLAVHQRNFDLAREELTKAQASIERFKTAAAAAEEEARRIGCQIREHYKNGGNTKDAVKLKAQQREAFENAEIMKSLAEDGDDLVARAKLDTHREATAYRSLHDSATVALQKHLSEVIFSALPDEFWKLIELIAYNASVGNNVEFNARADLSDPSEFALHEFARLLRSSYQQHSFIQGDPLIHAVPDVVDRYVVTRLQLQRLEAAVNAAA